MLSTALISDGLMFAFKCASFLCRCLSRIRPAAKASTRKKARNKDNRFMGVFRVGCADAFPYVKEHYFLMVSKPFPYTPFTLLTERKAWESMDLM